MHLAPSRGPKDREELRGETDLQGFPAQVRQFLHPHLLRGFLQRPVGTSSATETHCLSFPHVLLPVQWKAPLPSPAGGRHLGPGQSSQRGTCWVRGALGSGDTGQWEPQAAETPAPGCRDLGKQGSWAEDPQIARTPDSELQVHAQRVGRTEMGKYHRRSAWCSRLVAG